MICPPGKSMSFHKRKQKIIELVVRPGRVEGLDPPGQAVVGGLGVDQPPLKVTDPPVLALRQSLEARSVTVKSSTKF